MATSHEGSRIAAVPPSECIGSSNIVLSISRLKCLILTFFSKTTHHVHSGASIRV